MSRPPEVEAAMCYRDGPVSCVLTMSDGSKRYGHEILAGEVERLEKRENELLNALDMGQINCDAVYDELREEREGAKQRAEAAEARVRELEELCNAEDKRMEACDWFHQYREACIKIADMHDELEAVKAQNARLRAALEDIAAYDVGSRHAGTCPYGCDTPAIAQNTLAAEAGRARAATKALADGKAAP